MGFNKRYLDKDNLLSRYESGGIEEVMLFITKPDALISTDELSMDITDILHSEEHETLVEIKIEEKLQNALGSEENLVY